MCFAPLGHFVPGPCVKQSFGMIHVQVSILRNHSRACYSASRYHDVNVRTYVQMLDTVQAPIRNDTIGTFITVTFEADLWQSAEVKHRHMA